MGQSAEFGRFLKAMRSRLSPEQVGIPATSSGRRVPGLRREEIAMLADVSTDYYTRLEQGRNIHPSRAVLDSVARALRLDAAERAHMMDLIEHCANSQRSPLAAQSVRPALRQLLDAAGAVPALILGRRTDVLAGNRLAFLLLADFPSMPVHERNLTRWIILDPRARELFSDWAAVAAEATGALRVDIGRHPSDLQANQLVGELAVQSEHFRQWWAGHRVVTEHAGTIRMRHPIVGDLELNFEDLAPRDDPDQTLRLFSAKPGSPSADSLSMLGSYGAEERLGADEPLGAAEPLGDAKSFSVPPSSATDPAQVTTRGDEGHSPARRGLS